MSVLSKEKVNGKEEKVQWIIYIFLGKSREMCHRKRTLVHFIFLSHHYSHTHTHTYIYIYYMPYLYTSFPFIRSTVAHVLGTLEISSSFLRNIWEMRIYLEKDVQLLKIAEGKGGKGLKYLMQPDILLLNFSKDVFLFYSMSILPKATSSSKRFSIEML